ncbi:MAG: hypothetical protein LBP74_05980, partial [Treponema sp.]|nr:hypothetical protein [Treponema sp.]
PDPFAPDLFHAGVIQVKQRVVGVIDGLQGGHPRRALVAEIADNLADGGVIFLFDVAIIVFVGGRYLPVSGFLKATT